MISFSLNFCRIPAEKELRFLSLFDSDYKYSTEDNNYPVKEFCVCRVNSTRDFPVDSAEMTCRVSEAVSKCTNQRVPKEIMNFECTEYSEKRRKRDTWSTRTLLSTAGDSYSKPVIVKYPIEPLDVTKVEPYVVRRHCFYLRHNLNSLNDFVQNSIYCIFPIGTRLAKWVDRREGP